MSKRYLAVGLAAAALLACGACGGDDEVDPQEFAAEADEICTRTAIDRIEIFTSNPIPERPAEEAELLAEIVPLVESEYEELSALEPPDDVRAEYEEFLAGREEALEAWRLQLALTEEGGREKESLAAFDKREAAEDSADEPGALAGLGPCAHVVTPEDADEITTAATEVLISEDPTVCSEFMTETFLERGGLDLEKCKRQQQVDNGTKSVELSDIEGIPGALATALVVTKGGPTSGELTEMTFLDEVGTWKVDAYTEPPPPEENPEP